MATTAVQHRNDEMFPAPILHEIKAIMGNLPALLPPDISLEQFRAAAWLELRQVRGLDECSGESVAASLVKAANAGLLPGRDCHIIPFKNPRNGRKEATMIPGYQGLILSLERTGKVKKAFAHAVYSRDVFEVDYLMDIFSHKPSLMGDRGKMQCVYGCILEKDGTRHFEIMSLGQIDAIKARAPGHDSGPWTTDYEEMARKTALKRVMKYVRLSPQQQQLLADDDDRERSDMSAERFRETAADLYGEPREIPNFTQAITTEAKKPPTPTSDTFQEKNAANRHTSAANRHIDGVTEDRPARSAPPQTEMHGVQDDDIPPQVYGGETYIDQINAVLRAYGESEEGIATYWASTCRRCKVMTVGDIKMAWLPKLLDERREYYRKREQTQPVGDARQAAGQAEPEADARRELFHQITALLRETSRDEDFIAAYWRVRCGRYEVATPAEMPVTLLETLLHDLNQRIRQERRVQEKKAAVPTPAAEPGAWRSALADAALVVPESQEALHQEIAAALMSTDVPEEVGQALLQRVQGLDLSGLVAEEV